MIRVVLLLFLVIFQIESLDFRSNNYRQIINNALPTIDPQMISQAAQAAINPYTDIFVNPPKNLVDFPMANLASKSGLASTGAFWQPQQQSSTVSQIPWNPTIQTNPVVPPSTISFQSYQNPSTFSSTTTTSTTAIPLTYSTKTTTKKSTETLWTTSKSPMKLSKNPKPAKVNQKSSKSSATSFDSAQLSVLSHRLLNDVLIIPSSRRLYILAILPIHQSTGQQNFECGEIDLNAIVRMAAFLEALNTINESNLLKEIGADIGAIIVDSCSTDLRSVADLYELLSGTNIQRSDLIAIIRDDSTYMPNTEQIMRQLNLPVINTFFTTSPGIHTSGTLPSMSLPIQSIISALRHYQSTCVNVIFDEKYKETVTEFQRIALSEGMCVEVAIHVKNSSSTVAEMVVRRLLLSEARVVISFLSEDTWIQMTKALRSEMITPKTPINHQEEIKKLTEKIPKLSLPNLWLKQFWSSAFKCHVDNEVIGGSNSFSRECATTQSLNISQVTPDVDVSSISLAAHSIGLAFRSFVDRVCPGALVISLSDCVNDPFSGFHQSILDLDFVHHLSDIPVSFNYTTGFRDISLRINRVQFVDDRLNFSEIGIFDPIQNVFKDSSDTATPSARGSFLLMSSSCPKSTCAKELAKRTIKQQLPSIMKALTDIEIMIFTIFSVLSALTCLMCMYLKVISVSEYRNLTAVTFLGLSFLSLSAPAFIIPPNSISCSLRKLLFPIAISITIAPVFVKTVLIWKSIGSSSSSVLIAFCIVIIQTVISTEWLLLSSESATEFVSTLHGTMWRCSPGDSAEELLMLSCCLIALLSLLSFIFSVASLKHSQSLQHLMISVLGIFFETGLYVSLPLIPYKTRDTVMATTILLFSFVSLLLSHTGKSSAKEVSECGGTLQKTNENWLQHVVQSPKDQMALVQNYHTASTHPQSTMQYEKRTDGTLRRNTSLYGVEAYGL
uniref:G_PROTEIN_RECEP_F3_4 domain-containing protein n=1 Tax=Caenorhabditis tropicalis TaxID=1561998 RepID=A0A1I7V4W7_9PELO